MTKGLRIWQALVILLLGLQTTFAVEDATSSELDAFFAEITRTVTAGDFEAYKATYDEDAILVSGFSATSQPISQALDGWEQGFVDTRAGENKITLEFRFTQIFHDATTALATGMFHYASVKTDGERKDSYIHFESLLIKKNVWKTLMEYQKTAATQQEWDAAKGT